MPTRANKRRYNNARRPIYKKFGGKKQVEAATTRLQAVVRRAITQNNKRMLETKTTVATESDGQEMFHNSLYVRNSTLLKTTQGTADPESSNVNNRIGDKINLIGLSVKIMFELNERYSHGTFRIFIVKSAKGDVPTQANFFNNLSGNKMIDTINTDRFTVLASKTFGIKQSSTGMGESGIQDVGSGYTKGTPLISRATRIVKLWVPGAKLVRSKVLTYENGSQQPKFFDYHLMYFAYSNYSTTVNYYVGRINDEVIQLYYKDA